MRKSEVRGQEIRDGLEYYDKTLKESNESTRYYSIERSTAFIKRWRSFLFGS